MKGNQILAAKRVEHKQEKAEADGRARVSVGDSLRVVGRCRISALTSNAETGEYESSCSDIPQNLL